MTFRVHVDYKVMTDSVDIYLEQSTPGTRGFAKPLEFVARDPLAAPEPAEPVYGGWPRGDGRELMQAFLDAAWQMGLRPAGFKGEAEVAALRYHLEDMRHLAFKGEPPPK